MSVSQEVDSMENKNLVYRINFPLEAADILDLYRSAPLPDRAAFDENRITTMFKNSNLVISAWDGDVLVGVARSLTDFAYCCYVSDLAIREAYQTNGIGKELLRRTKEAAGDQCCILLLARATAMNYYPKVGFTKVENGFIIARK